MRKIILLLFLLLCFNHLLFSQVGYKVQNTLVSLMIKDTTEYFIQIQKEDISTRIIEMNNTMKASGKIGTIQQISKIVTGNEK